MSAYAYDSPAYDLLKRHYYLRPTPPPWRLSILLLPHCVFPPIKSIRLRASLSSLCYYYILVRSTLSTALSCLEAASNL